MASQQRRKASKQEVGGGPAVAAPAFPWRWHLRLIAALWLWTLIPYTSSFRAGFPMDSTLTILNDARVHMATRQNVDLIWSKDYWYADHTSDLYRPLTTMSFLFNYAVLGNGTHAGMYHVINFLVHAINVALVYLLGLVLLAGWAATEEHTALGGAGIQPAPAAPALALAAIWAVHPVLTESVTNIVGRADLLAGFGVLAGLLCHIRAGEAAGARRPGWLGALAIAVAIGVFSKESGVVVLGALAIYDLAFEGWRRRVWGYVAAGLPVLMYLSMRAQVLAATTVGYVPFIDNPLFGASFWVGRLTAIGVIGRYLWLMVWPAVLSPDYSYNRIPLFTGTFHTWSDWCVVVALGICIAAAVMAWRWRERNRALFFLTVFFFVALSPTANIFLLIGTIMGERFLYLPAISVVGGVVMAIFAIAKRAGSGRTFTLAAVAVIGVALAGRTFARNFDWFDERRLWTAAAKVVPESFKVHDALTTILLAAKPPENDRAVTESDREMAVLNGLPDELNMARPYAVAGSSYRKKGDSVNSAAEKETWYRKAIATLERGERIDRGNRAKVEALNGTQRVRAGWVPLYLELGITYRMLGENDKSLAALRYGRTLSVDPEFFQEISHTEEARGDPRQSAVAMMEALIYDPSWNRFAGMLVDLYKRTEPASCAVRTTGGATSLDMGCPLVHEELCLAARNVQLLDASRGEAGKAAATANTAIQELGCPAAAFQ